MLTAAAPPATQASQAKDAHLRVSGVQLIYDTSRGPLNALEGLTFDIRAGEFVCVVGPSGCGKSTLLKLISGLLPPSAGEVLLGGQPVHKPRPDVGIVRLGSLLLEQISLVLVDLAKNINKPGIEIRTRSGRQFLKLLFVFRFHFTGELDLCLARYFA